MAVSKDNAGKRLSIVLGQAAGGKRSSLVPQQNQHLRRPSKVEDESSSDRKDRHDTALPLNSFGLTGHRNGHRNSMVGNPAVRTTTRVAGGIGYETKKTAEEQNAEQAVLEKTALKFRLFLKTRRKDPKDPSQREFWDPKHPSTDTKINSEFNGIILTNARKIESRWESFVSGIPMDTAVRTFYIFENGKELHHSGVTISLDDVEVCVRKYTSRISALSNIKSGCDEVAIPDTEEEREKLSKTLEELNKRAKEAKRRVYFLIAGGLGAVCVPGSMAWMNANASSALAALYSGSISTLGAFSMGEDSAKVLANAGGCACLGDCLCSVLKSSEDDKEEGIDIDRRFGDHELYINNSKTNLSDRQDFTGILLDPMARNKNMGAEGSHYKIYIIENGEANNFSEQEISISDFELQLKKFIIDPEYRDNNGRVKKPNKKEEQEFRYFCMAIEKLISKARIAKKTNWGKKGKVLGVGLIGGASAINIAASFGVKSEMPFFKTLLSLPELGLKSALTWIGGTWAGYKGLGKLGNIISDRGGVWGFTKSIAASVSSLITCSSCCEKKPKLPLSSNSSCSSSVCKCLKCCMGGFTKWGKDSCQATAVCITSICCDAILPCFKNLYRCGASCLTTICCDGVVPCFKGLYRCSTSCLQGIANKVSGLCSSNKVNNILPKIDQNDRKDPKALSSIVVEGSRSEKVREKLAAINAANVKSQDYPSSSPESSKNLTFSAGASRFSKYPESNNDYDPDGKYRSESLGTNANRGQGHVGRNSNSGFGGQWDPKRVQNARDANGEVVVEVEVTKKITVTKQSYIPGQISESSSSSSQNHSVNGGKPNDTSPVASPSSLVSQDKNNSTAASSPTKKKQKKIRIN